MTNKARLSASVDAEMLVAAQEAVAEGRVDSVSSWVNDALRRQADHDRRLRALAAFVEAYEAEHGEITEAEVDDAVRQARAAATVVRGRRGRSPAGPRARRGAA